MLTSAILSTLADANWTFLLSPWKPLIIAATFIPWAWLISSKIDKDAAYFHLNRTAWNGWILGAGGVAILAMILIPIFYVGWPVGMILLGSPILVYWKVRNATVPEGKKFYLTTESLKEKMARRRVDRATQGALINFIDFNGINRDVPLKDEPLFPIHLVSEDLVGPAVESRASKVEMAQGPNGFVVAQTIDGTRFRRDPIELNSGAAVIDYLKDIAGLDVQNRRRRQTGSFKMTGPSGDNTVTLTTAGSSAGQEMRIEIDRADRINIPFDGIGLLELQIEALRQFEATENRSGVILLGAPGSQGLTTMTYSFIGRHDAYTTNVKTLEREVMLRHDGVDHVEFDADNPETDYATNLQSILRRDPDVVMVTDIMDKDTARIAAVQCVEGTMIYVPQRLPGVKEQVVDWVKRVGDLQTAVKPLRAIVNGRLLRTLCPNCRQPYRPTPEQLKRMHLPSDKVQQLFKANGKVQVKNKIENCQVCQGTGYFGQTGVFEVMVIDDAAKKLIASNDLQGAYTHARRNKMIFLQEAALRKVVEGVTTLEELARVITPSKATPKPKPQPTPA